MLLQRRLVLIGTKQIITFWAIKSVVKNVIYKYGLIFHT